MQETFQEDEVRQTIGALPLGDADQSSRRGDDDFTCLAVVSDQTFLSDPSHEIGLSMALSHKFEIAFRCGVRRGTCYPHIGQFGLLSPGEPVRLDIKGVSTVLQLRLPLGLAHSWWEEELDVDPRSVDLVSDHSVTDPFIATNLCAARRVGPLHAEEYLRAIALRLLQRHTGRHATRRSFRGGLSQRQITLVRDLVEANLAREIKLSEMAGVAQLSPFHFAREFRRTTGRSPHQFLIDRRTARAVSLLKEQHVPLAVVARTCGFTHQSHLSNHVRRALGHSPAQVRQVIFR